MENNSLKAELYCDVIKFNKEVIGTEQPKGLQLLNLERLDFGLKVLNEEVDEFYAAHSDEDLTMDNAITESIDALIDLIYFAFGRMYEMGVSPQQFADCWNEVHEKNMQKKKGNKGRGSDQDAIKPEGWNKPELHGCITSRFQHVDYADMEEKWKNLSELFIPKPFIEAATLRKKKGEDYRSGEVTMKDYFPFGLISYFTMINTKVLRLKSLLVSGKEAQNESIRDSLVDLMNYSCFAIEAIDNGEVD